MDKEELRKLEKEMDEYFENNTDIQVQEDIKKYGFQINQDLMDELEDPNNGITLISSKQPQQKHGNRGYINSIRGK